MGSFGVETMDWESQDSSSQDEKIYVAVRLRPLNEREIARNDVSDWECINNSTVIFKNTLHERSLLPAAYTFDRVFGCSSHTRQVYDEAAKKIVLSVISGINSTIFAYGQTGSGKTFTMSGITEYALADIYSYIDKHRQRSFVLKFSAMEIYNEAVKDLLRSDGTPLRLLDDPERGTIVDKLTEVRLRDSKHLRDMLAICAAQRQIGETSLNEQSSRSHQILRLTVESEARHYMRGENSSTLTASVNFVDLAGSERASQTHSAGTRLKEGCHINRSLLTLGTIIRKLGKGRNGHIPYRDSKLTRILQNSLGGNARTAIICTMSPAHSHVEQSRNTLHFASCAKQISTTARVNVVMSEKALVKQMQKELARLETELKNLTSLSSSGASTETLRQKELLIQKMEKEISELTFQRDLAESRVEDILRSGGDFQTPKSWVYMNSSHDKDSWADDLFSSSETSEIIDPLRSDAAPRTPISPRFPERPISPRFSERTPVMSPHFSDRTHYFPERTPISHHLSERTPMRPHMSERTPVRTHFSERTPRTSHFSDRYEVAVPSKVEDQIVENNEEQFLSDNTSPRQYIDKYFGPDPCQGWEKITPKTDNNSNNSNNIEDNNIADNCKEVQCIEIEFAKSNSISIAPSPRKEGISPSDKDGADRSKSCEAILTSIMKSPNAKVVEHNENNSKQQRIYDLETLLKMEIPSRESFRHSFKKDGMIGEAQRESSVKRAVETKSMERVQFDLKEKDGGDWKTEFEKQKREIIKLWDACRTPLVHRTFFHLFFKGDPSDAVYLEVELRRLSFLTNSIRDHPSSQKSLNREREMLSRRLLRKFSGKEREALYDKWDIDVKSKKRRLQLCRRLWTDPTNMEHVNESAAIVARLVDFKEQGQAPKEMFGLSFLPKNPDSTTFSWKHNLTSII